MIRMRRLLIRAGGGYRAKVCSPDMQNSERNRWGRWRKRLLFSLAGVVALVVATESFARYRLGLGDPPLSMSDLDTAYLFRANQTCRRFGNLIHYNAYSMRSDDFPARKSRRDEFRVMVIGDSVINGGAQTDQSQLCTSILQKELSQKLNRPVVVGNISAGGWGPLNEWPYIRKHGLFDADVVVIVLSSHDASSPFPTRAIAGADPSFPDHKPWCATWEAITRYLPKYLPALGKAGSNEGFSEGVDDPKVVDQCIASIRSMLHTAKSVEAKVYVALHWTQKELAKARETRNWQPKGHAILAAAAQEAGAVVVDLYECEATGKPTTYRDDIHLSAEGQKLLAGTLKDAVYIVGLDGRNQ